MNLVKVPVIPVEHILKTVVNIKFGWSSKVLLNKYRELNYVKPEQEDKLRKIAYHVEDIWI